MSKPNAEFDGNQAESGKQAEYREEWLSAYLDDELSPEQRRAVEHQLTTNLETQVLLNDLRRIRGLVSDLPGWTGPSLEISLEKLQPPGEQETELDRLENLIQDKAPVDRSIPPSESDVSVPQPPPVDTAPRTPSPQVSPVEELSRVEEIIAQNERDLPAGDVRVPSQDTGSEHTQPEHTQPEHTQQQDVERQDTATEHTAADGTSTATEDDLSPVSSTPNPTEDRAPDATYDIQEAQDVSAVKPPDDEEQIDTSPAATGEPAADVIPVASNNEAEPELQPEEPELNAESLDNEEAESSDEADVMEPDADLSGTDQQQPSEEVDSDGQPMEQLLVPTSTKKRQSSLVWLRPAALAASVLAITGIGYGLWSTLPPFTVARSTDDSPAGNVAFSSDDANAAFQNDTGVADESRSPENSGMVEIDSFADKTANDDGLGRASMGDADRVEFPLPEPTRAMASDIIDNANDATNATARPAPELQIDQLPESLRELVNDSPNPSADRALSRSRVNRADSEQTPPANEFTSDSQLKRQSLDSASEKFSRESDRLSDSGGIEQTLAPESFNFEANPLIPKPSPAQPSGESYIQPPSPNAAQSNNKLDPSSALQEDMRQKLKETSDEDTAIQGFGEQPEATPTQLDEQLPTESEAVADSSLSRNLNEIADDISDEGIQEVPLAETPRFEAPQANMPQARAPESSEPALPPVQPPASPQAAETSDAQLRDPFLDSVAASDGSSLPNELSERSSLPQPPMTEPAADPAIDNEADNATSSVAENSRTDIGNDLSNRGVTDREEGDTDDLERQIQDRLPMENAEQTIQTNERIRVVRSPAWSDADVLAGLTSATRLLGRRLSFVENSETGTEQALNLAAPGTNFAGRASRSVRAPQTAPTPILIVTLPRKRLEETASKIAGAIRELERPRFQVKWADENASRSPSASNDSTNSADQEFLSRGSTATPEQQTPPQSQGTTRDETSLDLAAFFVSLDQAERVESLVDLADTAWLGRPPATSADASPSKAIVLLSPGD